MNVLDDFRFPTVQSPAPDPESCCRHCGAGDHCHEVRSEGTGVMSRQCKVCGEISYQIDVVKPRTDGSGTWQREMVEKSCKNCGALFLAWKARFCKDCKTVGARLRKRRAMAGEAGKGQGTHGGSEFEPRTV